MTFLAAVLGGFVFLSEIPKAQAAVLELHGWAWSSNIGWVSFNCEDVSACGTTNYQVTFDDASGVLSGFAWSSSIGWINFAPNLSGAPDAAGFARVSNFGNGRVVGWVRACSVFVSGCSGALKSNTERGGWDGWIKLSGTNHVSPDLTGNGGVTYDAAASAFKGFAWGSDVIGWLNFNQVTLTAPLSLPEADIKANGVDGPINISSGASATLTWCGSPASPCANADSCSVSPGGFTGTSGTESTGSLTTSRTYTLTCTNVSGSTSDSVTVNVGVNAPPVADAGPNQTVATGGLVGLDGSASSDPDGDPLTHSWAFITRPVGSAATLSSSNSVTPAFTADLEGTYQIRLTVNDGALSDFDDVIVTAITPSSTFTLSCADTVTFWPSSPTLDTDPPCDLMVNFSPALSSKSTEATLTISSVPLGSFTSDIEFDVLQVQELQPADIWPAASGVVMSPSRYGEVYNNVEQPTFTATSPYSPLPFKLKVSKFEADPDVDRIFTVTLQASGGSPVQTKTLDLRLTLKATAPGFGE